MDRQKFLAQFAARTDYTHVRFILYREQEKVKEFRERILRFAQTNGHVFVFPLVKLRAELQKLDACWGLKTKSAAVSLRFNPNRVTIKDLAVLRDAVAECVSRVELLGGHEGG
jgi:hypothetical protein